ncbi:MAG: peptidylprolyl isomerase [Kofleriaceae bacterium]
MEHAVIDSSPHHDRSHALLVSVRMWLAIMMVTACGAPTFKLDNKYTAFGRVAEGMAAVDGIAIGEPPAKSTKIVRATIGGPLPAPPAAVASTPVSTAGASPAKP